MEKETEELRKIRHDLESYASEIIKKLEEIRCGLIDVEAEIKATGQFGVG